MYTTPIQNNHGGRVVVSNDMDDNVAASTALLRKARGWKKAKIVCVDVRESDFVNILDHMAQAMIAKEDEFWRDIRGRALYKKLWF
jgi:hypothetical protein